MRARRMAWLFGAALIGGSLLGGFAGAILFPPAGFPIGAIFGFFVGIASTAVVIPALEARDLAQGITIAYAPAFLIAIIVAPAGPLVAMPAVGFALSLGLLGAYLWGPLPPPPFGPNHCRRCGYDLAGLGDRRCPECGDARPTALPERVREPVVVIWLSLASAGLATLTIAGFIATARA